jgi:hypothetical protein
MFRKSLFLLFLLVFNVSAMAGTFIMGFDGTPGTSTSLTTSICNANVGRLGNCDGGGLTFIAGSADTVIKFSVYGFSNSGSDNETLYCAIYTVNASQVPVTRLGSASPIEVNQNGASPTWWHSEAVSIALTPGIEYCVAMGQSTTDDMTTYFSNCGSGIGRSRQATGTLTATWTESNSAVSYYGLYATVSSGANDDVGSRSIMETLFPTFAATRCNTIVNSTYTLYTASADEFIKFFWVYGYSAPGDNESLGVTVYTVTNDTPYNRGVAVNFIELDENGDAPKWWRSDTLNLPLSTDSIYGVAIGQGTDDSIMNYFSDLTGNGRSRQTSSATLGATWTHDTYAASVYSIFAEVWQSSAAGGILTPLLIDPILLKGRLIGDIDNSKDYHTKIMEVAK